jgi:hypothetical protein
MFVWVIILRNGRGCLVKSLMGVIKWFGVKELKMRGESCINSAPRKCRLFSGYNHRLSQQIAGVN